MATVHEVGLVWDELQQHLVDVVNGIQDAREIRTKAFARAEILGVELARLLKGHEFLPRYVLLGLWNAARSVANGAEYLQDPRPALELAETLETTYQLILLGECHSDRQPGIPRIR